MKINWYPGHMKKTKDSILKNLSMVDIVYEIIDARIPISSRNPQIDEILGDKPRVLILNKSDLADDKANQKWLNTLSKDNTRAVLVDSSKAKGINNVMKISEELTREKMERLEKRGINNRAIRSMIVGVPNVGKSTFINTVSGKRNAKVGNKPGVTRSNQWIKLKGNVELLDTPGILWPKFEDEEIGINLAITGAIKDELLDTDTLAFKLIGKLNEIDRDILRSRYNIKNESDDTLDILDEIGVRRGCVLKGKEIDYTKVCNIVLDEFRKGVLGRVTLELP